MSASLSSWLGDCVVADVEEEGVGSSPSLDLLDISTDVACTRRGLRGSGHARDRCPVLLQL